MAQKVKTHPGGMPRVGGFSFSEGLGSKRAFVSSANSKYLGSA